MNRSGALGAVVALALACASKAPPAEHRDLDVDAPLSPDAVGLEVRPDSDGCRAPAPGSLGYVTLAETGCGELARLVPYDLVVPPWLDGAVAARYLALPRSARMRIRGDGRLELPPGAVAVRALPETRLHRAETQLVARRSDGAFVFSSYGSDGLALPDPDCGACHTEANGFTLGLEIAQLDREIVYPGGRRGHQLATLDRLGMLDGGRPAQRRPLGREGSLEARARAYLHANCAYCHRGDEMQEMDLRNSVSMANTRVCGFFASTMTAGFAGRRRLVPGAPGESLLVTTVRAEGPDQMPPRGRRLLDHAGIALLQDFVLASAPCPSW